MFYRVVKCLETSRKENGLLLNSSRKLLSCLTLGTGLEKCKKETRENKKGMTEEVHE
jgi:hypothetical protein